MAEMLLTRLKVAGGSSVRPHNLNFFLSLNKNLFMTLLSRFGLAFWKIRLLP